ncbi:MAG: hypothetical protein AB8I08_12720 [Sandaracinaceae bacterium]
MPSLACYLSAVSRLIAIGLLTLLLGACAEPGPEESPRATVRLFLEAMGRSNRDPSAVREAYALLSRETRRSLQARAHVAVQVGAAQLEPWEMIARSRYRQTFTVASGERAMRASIDGSEAVVTVRSADGSRTAEVPLVFEDGHWRIVIDMPPPRRSVPEVEGAEEDESESDL